MWDKRKKNGKGRSYGKGSLHCPAFDVTHLNWFKDINMH